MRTPPQVKIYRDNHLLFCIMSEHFKDYSRKSVWGGLLITNVIDILPCACLPCARQEDGWRKWPHPQKSPRAIGEINTKNFNLMG